MIAIISTISSAVQDVAQAAKEEYMDRDQERAGRIPIEQYAAVLVKADLPEPFARVIADSTAAIARGELATDSGDLQCLLGRPSTPAKLVIEQALA
jgi:hypothetical protein